MKTNVQIIRALSDARDLISDPEHWTTGCTARDQLGDPCLAWDGTAARWCAAGAIARVAQFDPELQRLAGEALAGVDHDYGDVAGYEWSWWDIVTEWNDEPERSHEDILTAYAAAIETVDRRK